MTDYEKKLNKIYNKINKIASIGIDNELEYYKYINELIDKQDYTAFEDVLLLFYNIKIANKNIQSYKKSSWKTICYKTNSNLLNNLSVLYNKKSIYQVGRNIYDNNTNTLLGDIIEVDAFSPDASAYIKNNNFARIIGEKRTYLDVKKVTDTSYLRIDSNNNNLTEEQNLIIRYETAFDYLLT